MDGLESFKPDPRNQAAHEENLERKKLNIHNRGLHDEEGSEGINEATGQRGKTKAVDGADEKLRERSLELKLPKLPDDAGALARWMEKEKAKLEAKAAKRKKAA